MNKNEIKRSLTYVYNGSQDRYYEWADKLWNAGYNMSVQEVADKVGVSCSWIVNKWFSEIRHVNYSNKYIYNKTGKNEGLTRLSWEEVKEFLVQVSTFEVQTEIIDLYSYLMCDKKNADLILKLYRKKTKDHFYNVGVVPESVLNEINKHYITNLELKNLSPMANSKMNSRSKLPWVSVPKFDFIESPNLFVIDSNREMKYRESFMRGDLRIKFGNKKLWYLRNTKDVSEYKIPFLIPYGKSIVIYAFK